MDPQFLTVADVIEFHSDMIAHYGGSPGIRDQDFLQSAVAKPRPVLGNHYLHADVYEMAAAYLFHLVQNHPFIDGNKRVGAAAANLFLNMNDVTFAPDVDAYAELVLAVARGEADKNVIAQLIRANSRPLIEND